MSWREMEAYMGRPVPSDVLQRWADRDREVEVELRAALERGDVWRDLYDGLERRLTAVAGLAATPVIDSDPCPPHGIERPEVAA